MNPYWLEDDEPPRAAPAHAGRVDVAIVGAGITGCSAAWRLAQAGLTVRVHDQRGVAEGASGRNGGFALRGGASRYDIARETYGREQASELWHWTEHALDRMAELAGDSLRRTGSLRLAADADERDEIRGEFDAMREDGIAAEWIDEPMVGLEATAAKPPPPGRRIAGSPSAPRLGRFHGAILHTEDGALQPARFVRRLAARAADAGVEIREHDRVGDVATLDAEHVVVATDGYGHGLVPELADLVWPTRGQVIVSAPLDRVLYDKPHYARQGFDYWQQLPDGRLLLGGFRDVSIMDELTDVEETTPTIQASLERFMGELIGEAPAITHRWAGIFGLTQDMLPLVGRVPGHDNVWVAGGYSGHGNVLGFACGELVADAIRGDTSSPQLRLFDPARFF